jgi:hypothetical protein
MAVALAGCPATETKDAARPRVTVEPALDAPPPAWTAEAPDFADPKPPIPASSRAAKEAESTRDQLLHGDTR